MLNELFSKAWVNHALILLAHPSKLRSTFIILALAAPLQVNRGQAKVRPDATLKGERSVVTPINSREDRIDGGAARGRNLFHSFQDFNVGQGRGVLFANPTGIENIMSRVTGNNPSNILGELGVLGQANLFLLNPNGIIFGPNANLDIGGSFLSSTANTVLFEDGQEFTALKSQGKPILAINTPLGLKFGNRPAALNIRGARLAVDRGQSLLLAGGNINIEDARLIARGGRIELSSLATAGDFDLTERSELKTTNEARKSDITLSGTKVDVAAAGEGYISFDARNIDISDNSSLEAGIAQDQGRPGAQAGDIDLNANEDIFIQRQSRVANGVGGKVVDPIPEEPQAIGNGGDINLRAKTVTIRIGSEISGDNSGKGNTGLINIQAQNSVLLEKEILGKAFKIVDRNGIFSNINASAQGNTGDVVIETGNLTLRAVSRIQSTSFGAGNAGKVIIRAKDSVSLEGDGSNIFSSINLTQLSEMGRAVAGSTDGIYIETSSLTLRQGSRIESSIRLGTQVIGATNSGRLGSVKIFASDSILLEGESNRRNAGSGIFAVSVNQTPQELRNLIDIETGSLTLREGGRIRADNFGAGDGGDINIQARNFIQIDSRSPNFGADSLISSSTSGRGKGGDINLTTGLLTIETGSVTAETDSSFGGNIEVTAQEIRLGDTDITTSVNSGVGGGGDILLTAKNFIIATGDSDILAFSAGGNGGNIELDTPIFIGESLTLTPNVSDFIDFDGNGRVDINASGELNSGTISTPDNSIIEASLTELPNNLIDTSDLLANSCIVRNEAPEGSFIITGSDSLRARPGYPAAPSFPTGTVRTIPTEKTADANRPWQIGDPIVEPESVYRLPDGELVISRECQE